MQPEDPPEPLELADILSDEKIQLLLDYLEEDDSSQTRFGAEIEFFERNDIDERLAPFLYWQFPAHVNDYGSPYNIALEHGYEIKRNFSEEVVREIALKVRRTIRTRFGAPELSAEAERRFTMVSPKLPFEGAAGVKADWDNYPSKPLSRDELRIAQEYLAQNYHYVLHYLHAIILVSEEQGYTNLRRVSSHGVISRFLNSAIKSSGAAYGGGPRIWQLWDALDEAYWRAILSDID